MTNNKHETKLKASHTPGPWETDYTGNIWGDIENEAHDGDSPLVAQVFVGSSAHPHTDEGTANARLIAASPKLLAALRFLAEQADEDCPAEYGFAYRVLDAQHFGVPQRRRRVFVVGYLGDWRPAAAVLFEREGLLRDLTPRREAGKIIAVCPTLRAGGNRTGGDRPPGTDVDTADSLITHSLRAEGFDASEDGTGRGTPLVPVIAPCLTSNYGKQPDNSDTSNGPMLVPVAFSCKDYGVDAGDMAPTLRAIGHSGSHANTRGQLAVAFDTAQLTSKINRSNPQPGDPCHTLHSGSTHHVAIPINMQAAAKNGAKSPNGCGVGEPGDPAPTLGANDQHAVACFKGGQGSQARSVDYSEHLAPTLPSADSGSNRTPTLMQGMSVRRLTPRECERLQGFPDDYTLVPYRGKPAADGPRYKALGNSMAVPVMRWIGERIQMVERLRPEEAE